MNSIYTTGVMNTVREMKDKSHVIIEINQRDRYIGFAATER